VLRIMGSGARNPKTLVPGTDMAGVVEAVGENVTQFASDDDVFGETIRGMQWINGGAYAEYVSAPADSLLSKPSTVTFEEAAAVPTSGLIALQGIHYQGQVEPGQTVLVNGAGGGVGTFAVQIAKADGATVTGVDSPEKVETIASIGADHLIDYTEEDFTRGREQYDLILDIAGNHSFGECRQALTRDGKYVLIGHDHYGEFGRRFFGSIPRFLKLMAMSPFVSELSGMGFSTPPKSDSLATLREFVESGDLTPVVDRTFPLNEVPDAIRYLESGCVRGKVVISVSSAE
jgi:NADPH:quinone reductase-like Zn-dependent oxidoreductase